MNIIGEKVWLLPWEVENITQANLKECWKKKVSRYQIVLGADIFLSCSLRIKCFWKYCHSASTDENRSIKEELIHKLFFLRFLIAFCVNACSFGFSSVLQNIQFVFW